MESLADKVKKASEKVAKRDANPDLNRKICPFSTSSAGVIYCTDRCALYRKGKAKGFECPFTELTSMSWFIKGQPGKK